MIPSVPLCGEAQANAGTCPSASQIGTATVTAGAGPEPYAFSGPVSLTGPYGGAPYGLSVAVPAVAGPFNLGTVATRAAINVGLYDGRVTASGAVPTIVGGVPLAAQRQRHGQPTELPRQPDELRPLATETVLGSTLGAIQHLSSLFQDGRL